MRFTSLHFTFPLPVPNVLYLLPSAVIGIHSFFILTPSIQTTRYLLFADLFFSCVCAVPLTNAETLRSLTFAHLALPPHRSAFLMEAPADCLLITANAGPADRSRLHFNELI